jgi:hypothetical protein
LIGAAAVLSGCGTVSHVTPAPGASLDLQKYDRAIVRDFADDVTGKAKAGELQRKKAEMAVSTRSFADRIAIELGDKGGFREVTRSGEADARTLVISGRITRYEEGDTVGRMFTGVVGTCHFDAEVEVRDGATSQVLATQKIDANSWPLGGDIAAVQSTESFMRSAAKKLAADINTARQTGKFPGDKRAEAGMLAQY